MVIWRKVRLILHREMHRGGTTFWEWTPFEWLETICPNSKLFHEKHVPMPGCRMSIMDMAYLFGGVTDLRFLGMRKEMTETAWTYFGKNCVNEQCERVYDQGFSQMARRTHIEREACHLV